MGVSKQKAMLYVPYITAKHPTVLYCIVIYRTGNRQTVLYSVVIERLQSLEVIMLQMKGIVSSLHLLDILLTVL